MALSLSPRARSRMRAVCSITRKRWADEGPAYLHADRATDAQPRDFGAPKDWTVQLPKLHEAEVVDRSLGRKEDTPLANGEAGCQASTDGAALRPAWWATSGTPRVLLSQPFAPNGLADVAA